MIGKVKDSRACEGYRSVIYQCAQDMHALYCENGQNDSIFYQEDSEDLIINLLFKCKLKAFHFQQTILKFKYIHPKFGERIEINDTIEEVQLEITTTRVLVKDCNTSGCMDSPTLTYSDILTILSDDFYTKNCDPILALQSFEDITKLPDMKYYFCRLLPEPTRPIEDENICIWGTKFFHQFFDGWNIRSIQVLRIAIRFIRAEKDAENISVGNGNYVTRRRVTVCIEFHNSVIGIKIAKLFQSSMKPGTIMIDQLHFESFIYPEDVEQMQLFLEKKYQATIKSWSEDVVAFSKIEIPLDEHELTV